MQHTLKRGLKQARDRRRERASWIERYAVGIAISFLVAAILIIAMIVASAQDLGTQEPTLCRDRPADTTSRWSWRSNVSGRGDKCWYRGEPMRPRHLLFWVEDPPKPSGWEPDPVLIPSDFHDRFEAGYTKPRD